jgi:hypothetical protein
MTNPMREVTLENIVDYLTNGGLTSSIEEFEFADDNDAFKYIGYSWQGRSHQFLVGTFDEENNSGIADHYVSVIHVYLGANGLLCADYSGCPVFDGSADEVLAYIEKRCN